MRTKKIISGSALVALLVWWLIVHYAPPSKTPDDKAAVTTNDSNAVLGTDVASLKKNIPETQPLLSSAERVEQIKKSLEEGKNEWRAPINFYGRVINESNSPVSAANIHFIWTDLSPTGNSEKLATSDENGFFTLLDATGKNLIVTVSKVGYYSYQPSGAAFNYSGENHNFVADQGNPIVFRLRKRGEGAALVHYDKSFRLPRDGTPVLIDLATANVTTSGQNTLQVEGWTQDSQKKEGWKYDWKCRVSVPGGGLQIYDEQFPFLAPESNYIPEDVIDMPVTNGVPWSYIVHRNFYVHTADGKFGRMIFTMVAGGDNFCELNLYFNPTGSRNLESESGK
jgi:hypothetical protein